MIWFFFLTKISTKLYSLSTASKMPTKRALLCYGKIKKAQKALLRLCKLRVYWLIMSVAFIID
jgi:hypothetical protein